MSTRDSRWSGESSVHHSHPAPALTVSSTTLIVEHHTPCMSEWVCLSECVCVYVCVMTPSFQMQCISSASLRKLKLRYLLWNRLILLKARDVEGLIPTHLLFWEQSGTLLLNQSFEALIFYAFSSHVYDRRAVSFLVMCTVFYQKSLDWCPAP